MFPYAGVSGFICVAAVTPAQDLWQQSVCGTSSVQHLPVGNAGAAPGRDKRCFEQMFK